ncbi:MAG TPA: response regulator [Thermohalobaculum sp.]|nr:response regulator [Thermohalobaculum sp.]
MPRNAPRILIVEDSYMVAMEMKAHVEKCGCSAVGPVATVEDALEAVRQSDLDGAILDINLGEERVWPVADLLEHQGVAFILASGYASSEVPPRFRARRVLAKPVDARTVRAALAEIGLAEA